jgi:hypothetical protein
MTKCIVPILILEFQEAAVERCVSLVLPVGASCEG